MLVFSFTFSYTSLTGVSLGAIEFSNLNSGIFGRTVEYCWDEAVGSNLTNTILVEKGLTFHAV